MLLAYQSINFTELNSNRWNFIMIIQLHEVHVTRNHHNFGINWWRLFRGIWIKSHGNNPVIWFTLTMMTQCCKFVWYQSVNMWHLDRCKLCYVDKTNTYITNSRKWRHYWSVRDGLCMDVCVCVPTAYLEN